MEDIIVNRVAKSGLQTLDLGDFFPEAGVKSLDIAPWLFHGLILKEKDFRQHLEDHDWSRYSDAVVAVSCSADAIIPVWAYMLIAARLQGIARLAHFGNEEQALSAHYRQELQAHITAENFRDTRVVIKGCGDKPIPTDAYMTATALLQPLAKSIMYGEPCSTVPVYKKK